MSDQTPPFGVPSLPPPPSSPPPPAPVPPAPIPTPYPVVAEPQPAQRVVVTQRRGPGALGTILIAGVVAAVVGAFAGLAGYMIGRGVDTTEAAVSTPTTPVVIPQFGGGTSPRANGSISTIADATLPAVVSILAEGTTQSGSGSGFVVRPNGYIMTNNHVVDLVKDGGTLTVVFSDGKRSKGTVVGTNTSYDIAVVKVDRTGLPTVPLGNSADVKVGDTAIAIGAPLGLEGTVTSGIISALNRPVTAGSDTSTQESFINAIQTDAAINPGNSGGPLLNGNGAVIGVNSAIASLAPGVNGEAGNIGLGFAIPINSAKRIAEELIATGKSRTPLIGVKLEMSFAGPGAKVQSVTSGSPADKAGLRGGDVILEVNGRSIDDATELVVEIRNHAPGEKIDLGYTRSGQDQSTTLTLADDADAG
ncbi:MAG: trypsin-like peptidase domain-containing protein [Actinomycetes bacterium]